MNTTLIQTGRKWLKRAVENPKKFFTYSMVFLIVSYIGSMIQGIFFSSETVFKIKPPVFYSHSTAVQNKEVNHKKEMKKIVTELKALKIKRDHKELQKEDSLRIEYLFSQYQQLKNGR